MSGDKRTGQERFFTSSEMKKRGWTDGLIKKLLGEPDMLKRNPVFRSKAPMKLYEPQRVLPLEDSSEFQEMLKGLAKRREVGRRIVERKAAKVRADVAEITIRVSLLERDRLISRACWHYNHRAADRGEASANEGCDQEFLDRISVNYLRHSLTAYEQQLPRFFGRVGQAEAYTVIKRKVLDAIARAYPWLAAECERQTQDCMEVQP
jgi:hypothetical protein